jgi:hypothetical protein
MRILHTVDFKLNVTNYAKEHSNNTAKRHFGPPPTGKWHMRRRVTEEHILENWLHLEAGVKNCTSDHQSNRIGIYRNGHF